MSVIMNEADEEEYSKYCPGPRKPASRCSTCRGQLRYPYAAWTVWGTGHSLFFCSDCCRSGGGLARDLNEIATIKRARTAMRTMPITNTRH